MGARRRSVVMMAGNDCNCPICRVEANLFDQLSHESDLAEYRSLACRSPVLARFVTAPQLLAHLHCQSEDLNCSADEVILELVQARANPPFQPVVQSLLLLVFVPTIHRTATQIATTFPLLGRDDIAQHLFTALLEFFDSQELRSQRTHLAFVVARRMRRSGFRWAIRESRFELPDAESSPAKIERVEGSADDSYSGVLLRKFLDNCQSRGWLSAEERELLTRFKLEGATGAEIARQSGHSAIAIRHRVQRLLDRLRRMAQKSGSGATEQLDLFRS